jgi:hypothetical protein
VVGTSFEISFLEAKNVRNNLESKVVHKVRKWPNLCSIRPRKYFGKLVEKFRLID